MRKKIRNSLSIKVFLWVFAALTVCSTIIYAVVLAVLPKQYQITSDRQMEQNVDALVSEISNMGYDDGIQKIYNFCIQNNATAMLIDDKNTVNFGEIQSNEQTVATSTISTDIAFSDRGTECMLVLSSVTQAAERISNLMLRFLPVVFFIIILLSVLSAFICSKVIVTPIAKISQISKRMTSLDMTWRCDIESDDEIGVLASSLNTMASRLQTTMEELENANAQLTADVKKFQALEEQRRNFFAAVSHELKTPLTILKGQIENMMLGYGDYQNHEKYLPEALKATEDIEYLVKEIITISKMERMELQDTLQNVSLLSTVNETIETLLPLAKDKNIQIYQNITIDISVPVNRNLWNKALSNIIGNAIRHSPCGEEVFISLQSFEQGNTLVVENTGVFISEADLPHMFTPFYRTDKSRSKATGGSGLGMYIVKTILDLHGMEYSIQNTPKGVSFFLYLN
ncbi:MAG: HAMP domain-containing sensor histidine kinase [Eubacteriales bacterium]|nr:HAMP domain-containing sensor histidine kinase [Eubacteriales bacterium]